MKFDWKADVSWRYSVTMTADATEQDSVQSGRRAVRLRITGKVQGVWFRGWTVERAQELQLDGWVRNRQDGTVEVLVVGASERIDILVRACRKGPPAARVERVEVAPAQGITPKGFTQKPTV